jgi:hypothetical protein
VAGGAGTNAAHIRYAYDAKSSAQPCRLRSNTRNSAYDIWVITNTGSVGSYYGYVAKYSLRSAPACVIC